MGQRVGCQVLEGNRGVPGLHPSSPGLFQVLLQATDPTMDPLSELQDDLALDDPSQTLNQLKLASIDEKNWPSDDMPDFPKSGGHCWVSGSQGRAQGAEGRADLGHGRARAPGFQDGVTYCFSPYHTLTLVSSSDDSKSSSPEPVTHLKWDDPYYDIARHQIVEVAGTWAQGYHSFHTV